MVWKATDPQGNEVGKMLWELVPYTRGFGLDLGCGPDKGFPHFLGVDNKKDCALFNTQMEPDVVMDARDLKAFATKEELDALYESIAPERARNSALALDLERLLGRYTT